VIKNLFIVAVLAAATFFLFSGAPDNLNAIRSVQALWNLGHVVYFALFTYLISLWPGFNQRSVIWRWSVTLLLVLLVGLVVEVLQFGTDRSSDLADLSRNLVGALLVLAFTPRLALQLSHTARAVARFAVSVIFLLHLLPLSLALFDEAMARAQFPLLSAFDTAIELDRWSGEARIERVQLDVDQSDRQLKIHLSTAQYSGTGLQYFPADWSEYSSVTLRFYQPLDEVFRLTIRIHDEWHNN